MTIFGWITFSIAAVAIVGIVLGIGRTGSGGHSKHPNG